ncbi:MAG: type II toxin-antitoxin system VapC family toxin [Nitrososphaeria archaeon]
MSTYILDASVAARFLLFEELSDKAVHVLEDFMSGKIDLVAPELLIYEVGNVLWKAFKQGLVNLQDVKEKISYFLKLGIDFVKLERVDYENMVVWSIKNNVTYYDAAYIVVTEKIKGVLLSADNIFYEIACREVPTLHLRDYKKM